jgi:adenylyltransferase/sulfurtransferase
MSGLNDQQRLRYSRSLLLKNFDESGQEKLLQSKVLIIGCGGLGTPAAMYLAAMGVGQLWLMDGDRVELSNLPRQVLYRPDHLGQFKAEVLAAQLTAQNPDCQTLALPHFLSDEDFELIDNADLVLDCTDNFASRYRLNRLALASGTAWLSAAAQGFHGQLIFFEPKEEASPCYACFYPEDNQADDLTCSGNGVWPPVVGSVGVLQAVMASEFLVGMPLETKVLYYFDGKNCRWRQIRLPQDPACSVCRER